jgi:hypothetical protein
MWLDPRSLDAVVVNYEGQYSLYFLSSMPRLQQGNDFLWICMHEYVLSDLLWQGG